MARTRALVRNVAVSAIFNAPEATSTCSLPMAAVHDLIASERSENIRHLISRRGRLEHVSLASRDFESGRSLIREHSHALEPVSECLDHPSILLARLSRIEAQELHIAPIRRVEVGWKRRA